MDGLIRIMSKTEGCESDKVAIILLMELLGSGSGLVVVVVVREGCRPQVLHTGISDAVSVQQPCHL